MTSKLQSLQDDLEYYSSQLSSVGSALVGLMSIGRRFSALLLEAGELYELLTLDLIDTYNAMKRILRKDGFSLGGPQSISIKFLEKTFIILRDAAEEAEILKEKRETSRTHQSRILRKASEEIKILAENAAKVLVTEAHKEGLWTVEWEQRLGLRRWLR